MHKITPDSATTCTTLETVLGKIKLQIKSHCAYSYNFGSTAGQGTHLLEPAHLGQAEGCRDSCCVHLGMSSTNHTQFKQSVEAAEMQKLTAGPQQSLSILLEASAPCPSAYCCGGSWEIPLTSSFLWYCHHDTCQCFCMPTPDPDSCSYYCHGF